MTAKAPLRLVSTRDERAPSPADRERFRVAVMPHLDAAYSYARYLTRDPTAAEDIVQDAFLRALSGIATCRGNEKAWLLAIVRNGFLDWARRSGRRTESLDGDAAEIADLDDPEAILQRRHDAMAVRTMVETLPEPFREALVLRELEELSYREIAGLTGAPIGTVMSRLARARAMLGQVLGGSGRMGVAG